MPEFSDVAFAEAKMQMRLECMHSSQTPQLVTICEGICWAAKKKAQWQRIVREEEALCRPAQEI